NGKVTGYDVDCAVRFCKAYGYGLEIVPMSFGAIIPALQSEKCDFAMSSFAYTKERAENVLFSYPNAKTGNVFLVMKTHSGKTQTVSTAEYTDISQLNGKIIGVTAGSIHDRLAKEKIPDAEIVYFNSNSDILPALLTGKIDAIACGESTALFMMREGHKITYLPQKLQRTNRKAAFAKTERGRKLCKEYSDFLQTLWDNGTIKALVNKWIDSDDDSKRFVEDYSNLPNPNGTLIMAVDPSVPPYLYMKDRRIQGYEIDLAVMFCKAKGYGLNVESMSHNGVLGSLETGKCDFSYGIDFTDEREKSLILSKVPNTDSANVIVVLKHKPSEVHKETSADAAKIESKPSDNEPSFWDDIALSFNKTFIREERWELFLEGIMATMTITISSIFFGMLLGFTAFMFCRTGNAIANIFTKFSVWLIKGTPNVVLLMILYYVIFGNVNISGVIVSIIAFTLTFGTAVYRMLTFGTGAVDRGQTEAAYALGFTDLQTFFRVILPQAALHFMPSLREEVTLLIKSTSVVGYIAVQDLTKMGDIVRSRTYEAFFPLIAVAVIYFILAGMLNIVVTFIEYRITPSRRKPENILRGIDVTGGENHD
ncbi:MAG: transporter substrate-binding domain-containing protein, partial [Synergistaceae bacterium]|nr:transporter substrate-binding domain-containing protein [Synergistaceae bacterium]